MRKYSAGSMPVSELLRPGLPRTARPEPAATGATTRTPGRAWICAATARHWSMDFSRCRGGCTMAPSMAGVWAAGSALAADLGQVLGGPATGPPRSCRVTCWAGSNWTGAWALSTRRMKLACRPDSSADMKTITATPMATPVMMNRVCKRPSRRKRSATIHSDGSQVGNIGAPPAQGAGAAGAAEPAAARTRAPAATAAVWRAAQDHRQPGRPAPRPIRRCAGPGAAAGARPGRPAGPVPTSPDWRCTATSSASSSSISNWPACTAWPPATGTRRTVAVIWAPMSTRWAVSTRPLATTVCTKSRCTTASTSTCGPCHQCQVPAASARPTRAATHHGPRQRRAGTCSVLFMKFQPAAITVGSGRRGATGAGRCQVPRARASGRSSRPGRSAA